MKNKDAEAIARAFGRIPKSVRTAMRPAIEKGAKEIKERAKALAPEDERHLIESIDTEPGQNDLSVVVKADDPAALPNEYGTANMDAQPFWWVTVNSLKGRVRRRIDRAGSKAIKDEWGKS